MPCSIQNLQMEAWPFIWSLIPCLALQMLGEKTYNYTSVSHLQMKLKADAK